MLRGSALLGAAGYFPVRQDYSDCCNKTEEKVGSIVERGFYFRPNKAVDGSLDKEEKQHVYSVNQAFSRLFFVAFRTDSDIKSKRLGAIYAFFGFLCHLNMLEILISQRFQVKGIKLL